MPMQCFIRVKVNFEKNNWFFPLRHEEAEIVWDTGSAGYVMIILRCSLLNLTLRIAGQNNFRSDQDSVCRILHVSAVTNLQTQELGRTAAMLNFPRVKRRVSDSKTSDFRPPLLHSSL